MRSFFKFFGFLLISLAIIDFILGTFFNIDITGYRRSPAIIGGLGSMLIYLSFYLFKPKEMKVLDNVISKTASLYFEGTKYDGKLYITPELLKFDSLETFDISYNNITSIEETKKMGFKGFKIKTIDNKEYSIVMFGFKKVSKIIIDYYEENKA